MKILVVSDIHYSLKQYDWLLDNAERFDSIIIAGDLLDLAGSLQRDAQSVVVMKYLSRLSAKTKLLVCSGNHDSSGKNEYEEHEAIWLRKARYLGVAVDGDSVELGDILLTICPWWDGEHTLAYVNKQLEKDSKKREAFKKWIWIYHTPPVDSPTSWTGKTYWGDKPLLGWIEEYQPDIVFSGHVHESPFVPNGSWCDLIGETWVFNTGRELSFRPTHLTFDTDACEICWFSSEGVYSVKLNDKKLPVFD
ncbi:MAG: metallophosphoesterase [Verrucomicrobiota bacterium]